MGRGAGRAESRFAAARPGTAGVYTPRPRYGGQIAFWGLGAERQTGLCARAKLGLKCNRVPFLSGTPHIKYMNTILITCRNWDCQYIALLVPTARTFLTEVPHKMHGGHTKCVVIT